MLGTHFWKKYFKEYDVLNQLIPYSELLKTICDRLDIKQGDIILDAGSGTGNLSLIMSRKGGVVNGIDYSQEGIDIHKTKDLNAHVIRFDLTQSLPFPDEYFDKIASNNVLYTISRQDRKNIFNEFFRVLKPGGTIVVSNLSKDFSAFKIYTSHVQLYMKTYGFLKTIYHLGSLIIPTCKILYYNYLIKKEDISGSYVFFEKNEQKQELLRAGFSKVFDTELHYANQLILNKAIK
jgi:ubiquinone/menaquinone biosynthesis C-methylase UbiE